MPLQTSSAVSATMSANIIVFLSQVYSLSCLNTVSFHQFSCCLSLRSIIAFSLCKYNKCVIQRMFQPVKPAITAWCWHFTFDSASWNPVGCSDFLRLQHQLQPSRGQESDVSPMTPPVTVHTAGYYYMLFFSVML